VPGVIRDLKRDFKELHERMRNARPEELKAISDFINQYEAPPNGKIGETLFSDPKKVNEKISERIKLLNIDQKKSLELATPIVIETPTLSDISKKAADPAPVTYQLNKSNEKKETPKQQVFTSEETIKQNLNRIAEDIIGLDKQIKGIKVPIMFGGDAKDKITGFRKSLKGQLKLLNLELAQAAPDNPGKQRELLSQVNKSVDLVKILKELYNEPKDKKILPRLLGKTIDTEAPEPPQNPSTPKYRSRLYPRGTKT